MNRTTWLMLPVMVVAIGLSGCGAIDGAGPFGEQQDESTADDQPPALAMPGEVDGSQTSTETDDRPTDEPGIQSTDDQSTTEQETTTGDQSAEISVQDGPETESSSDTAADPLGVGRDNEGDVGIIEPEFSDPERARSLAQKGKQAYEEGNNSVAIEHFTKATMLDSTRPEYQINLGSLYFNQENYEAAIDHYRKALELDPDHASAHTYLGSALLFTDQPDEARQHLEQALELEPDNQQAQQLLDQIE